MPRACADRVRRLLHDPNMPCLGSLAGPRARDVGCLLRTKYERLARRPSHPFLIPPIHNPEPYDTLLSNTVKQFYRHLPIHSFATRPPPRVSVNLSTTVVCGPPFRQKTRQEHLPIFPVPRLAGSFLWS